MNWLRTGDPLTQRRAPNGAGSVDKTNGDRLIFVDGKQQKEHRVIASNKLGRPLLPGEVVHHLNGVRTDNRPENLDVLQSQSEHMKIHYEAGEILARNPRRL